MEKAGFFILLLPLIVVRIPSSDFDPGAHLIIATAFGFRKEEQVFISATETPWCDYFITLQHRQDAWGQAAAQSRAIWFHKDLLHNIIFHQHGISDRGRQKAQQFTAMNFKTNILI